MLPAGPPRTLLRDRRIALVWTAGLVAWIGHHAMFVVLPFVVFDSTASPGATALTVLASALPPVLLGQVAGVVTDRRDRRRVLLGANLALAGLTIGFVFIGDWGWIAVLSFARSCVAQLVGPAEHALLPELAPDDRLGELASLNTLNNTLARLVGPACGGMLLAAAGFSGVVGLVVVCHVLCAVLVLAVDHRSPGRESDRAGPGMLTQWREGATIVRQQATLRLLVPLVAIMALGEGFVSALLAPFTREFLDSGPEVLGWILSAQAIGGALGALWSTRVADRRSPLPLLAVAALVAGILLLVVFTYPLGYPAVWPAVALTTLAGAPFAVVAAMQGTLLQTQSPPGARGRVFSLFWGVASLAQLLGTGLAGALAERFGSIVVALDGVAYVIAGLLGLAAARRMHGRGGVAPGGR